MNISTVGFTKKSASEFFELLKESAAERLVDVRLNNVSQLAGFAKRDDLEFFLRELCGMGYEHELRLAPTQPMLDDYRKKRSSWDEYARRFTDLMAERQVESAVPRELLDNAVLLCSEPTAERCHRGLVVEYLAERWTDVRVTHL